MKHATKSLFALLLMAGLTGCVIEDFNPLSRRIAQPCDAMAAQPGTLGKGEDPV